MDTRTEKMQKQTSSFLGWLSFSSVGCMLGVGRNPDGGRYRITPLLLVGLVIGAFVVYSSNSVYAAQAKNVGEVNVASMPSSLGLRAVQFGGWNYAVIGVGQAGALPAFNVYNYDPVSGKRDILVPQPPYLPPTTRIDGVSSSGQNLLYQFSQSGHTLYYTLKPLAGTGFFYELNDASAGNALWLSDSRHVLVLSLNNAVEQVDTQTGQALSVISLPIHNANGTQTEIGQLVFTHAGYLYFVGSTGFCEGTLCRVQLGTSNPVVQQISFRSLEASYWLSPDDQTIYFANKQGPAGEAAVYAVNSDGSNLRVLRTFAQYPDATPIGYAADYSLVIMTIHGNQFEVVKLGATLAQDTVVLGDAAPGATSLCGPGVSSDTICDANIAFAPYGHAMIVTGTYANGTQKVWSDDLAAGQQSILLNLPSKAQVALPGWDRIVVM